MFNKAFALKFYYKPFEGYSNVFFGGKSYCDAEIFPLELLSLYC